jgi:rod shape determining protein RodA
MKPRDLDLTRLSWTTLITALLLLAIGFAFVYSASYRPGPGGEGFYTSSPSKQLIWMAVGACAAFCVLCIHYEILVRYAYWLYGAALVLVLLVPVVGAEINGAKRWIILGPLRLQPSEFLKIAMILALAKYLLYNNSYRRLSGLLVPFLLTFVPMLVIARQPDLGTALMLLPIAFAILYAAGARASHLTTAILVGVLMIPAVWLVMKPYQRQRIVAFFEQESLDPEMRMGRHYQIIQAKTAIGSGQLWGKGWLKGTQNRLAFIPKTTKNNDFIFAVICEEAGFVGATGLLVLFFVFLAAGLNVAEVTRDPSARLITVGVVALFATQLVVNTAMTAGQLPTVGLPLPFISYGGSSLLTSFIGLGLILNVSMRRTISLASDQFNHSDTPQSDSFRFVTGSA